MRRVVVAAVCALLTTVSGAQSNVFGPGASSCGKYLANREKREKSLDLMYSSWVQGFVTGINFERSINDKATVSKLDPYSVLPYLDKYCRDNPLKDLTDASMQLVLELLPPGKR